MKTVAIIQARMGASRLPGKMLAQLGDQIALSWIVRAARSAVGIDEIVVATSTAKSDDPIADWCDKNKVNVFRGSEADVLSRYADAARANKADVVVRLTGDCPLHDPAVIGAVVRLRKTANAGYASNVEPATWPDGLDCEVMTAKALFAAEKDATRKPDREHVTPFIRRNRVRFPAENLVAPLPGLSGERWTLDTPEDLQFLDAVAQELPKDRAPSFLDVLSVLDRKPQLRGINATHARNEGFTLSEQREPIFLDRTYKMSQNYIERSERAIPLGSQTFSKSRLQYPPGASPLFVSHGNGGRVYDIDGNEYVDLVSALLPNVLGYCDPDVDAAIRKQLNSGITLSLPAPLETELAERLIKHIPCAEMVRFGKNGTDATSAAIRLARASTRRDRVIALGYHGWQDWYIGATTRKLGIPGAVSELTHLAPYGNLDEVEKLLLAHRNEFAAIILEPAGGSEPAPGYLQGLKDLAHRHGALLVFDEVITGFRWSLGGAQARYGVTPDLAAFGKAMGNGMPISAVVGRADVMRLMEDIFYSGTFGGETLSLAASIATIDKIEREKVVDHLWAAGAALKAAVTDEISSSGLQDVIGLAGAPVWTILTFKDHARASKEAIKTLLLRELIRAGVLLNASHNICYAHSAADYSLVIGAYKHALPLLRGALDNGDIERQLGNQVIRPIFTLRATPA
jgi:glutamate-1-semialdehyde 2,1-aminomutase